MKQIFSFFLILAISSCALAQQTSGAPKVKVFVFLRTYDASTKSWKEQFACKIQYKMFLSDDQSYNLSALCLDESRAPKIINVDGNDALIQLVIKVGKRSIALPGEPTQEAKFAEIGFRNAIDVVYDTGVHAWAELIETDLTKKEMRGSAIFSGEKVDVRAEYIISEP